MRKFRITYELEYDDAPPTTPEEVAGIALAGEDDLADRFWAGDPGLAGEGLVKLKAVEEAGDAARDVPALSRAIRRFTTGRPNGVPSNETERQIDQIKQMIDPARFASSDVDLLRWVHGLNAAMVKLCVARETDALALRLAAENHFGGDFRSPATEAAQESARERPQLDARLDDLRSQLDRQVLDPGAVRQAFNELVGVLDRATGEVPRG